MVFKLMMKDSAEGWFNVCHNNCTPTDLLERIMQVGKKKLVLDHVVVQKMDDNDDEAGDNVQSILTYGAQALFESEQDSRDIVCE